jgi:uncharacterized protein (UPF0261 family)
VPTPILIIGAFDTKGQEYAFLREQILKRGHQVLTMNTGVLGSTDLFPVDFDSDVVLGNVLKELREQRDRGRAMAIVSGCAGALVKKLHEKGRFSGIIGMGGGTMASGDTARYVGEKDIVLFPSIADVAGINRITRIIFTRAAGAICGMVDAVPVEVHDDKPVIAASMFGNTTECVNLCRESLTAAGFEVLVFHATGTGGRMMESLVDEGMVDGVLDITTTEWADEIAGGIMSAGPHRLSAPGRKGVPHLIVPGCVDMANFGTMESVPQKYKDANRLFYKWNPAMTLMRTNVDENRKMGEIFARMANDAGGPVAFLIPLRGVSILDGDGQPFCDRAADQAMFDAIRANLRKEIPLVEMDVNINDPKFTAQAVAMMLGMMPRT